MAGDLMSFPSNCRVWRSICVESNVGRLMYTQFSSLSVGSWGSHSLAGSHNSKTEDMISWGQELSCPPCRLWTHQWSMQPERVPHVYDKDQGFTDTAPLTILHARIWSQDESCPRKSIYVEATLFAEMTTTWFKNIHCRGWSWGWSSNTLATWCEELTHWKWPWCWERLKAGGEGDDRGRDGRMASLTQWTWVWANSRNWWWTGKPGVLQPIGLQRVGYDWATEQQQKWFKSMSSVQLLPEDHIANSRHQLPQNPVQGGMLILAIGRRPNALRTASLPNTHILKWNPAIHIFSTTVFPTMYHEHISMLTYTHFYRMIFESSIIFGWLEVPLFNQSPFWKKCFLLHNVFCFIMCFIILTIVPYYKEHCTYSWEYLEAKFWGHMVWAIARYTAKLLYDS